MDLREARLVALEVIEVLAPACDRVEIAGSVRRGKAEPKDVEIVYIPRMVEERVNLFDVAEVPATEGVIAELVREGWWEFDAKVRRNGPRYKRMVRRGVVVELFRAERGNWGYLFALRTGPGDFNRMWATHGWGGGTLPVEVRLKDGWVWAGGERVVVETEEAFFDMVGIPWWEPGERSGARLGRWKLGFE